MVDFYSDGFYRVVQLAEQIEACFFQLMKGSKECCSCLVGSVTPLTVAGFNFKLVWLSHEIRS